MVKLQPVRGTRDLLGNESLVQRYVINTAQKISERYGYEPIDTPVFEFTDVFKRTLGNASDIVTKEMYTFEDKGENLISLYSYICIIEQYGIDAEESVSPEHFRLKINSLLTSLYS